MTQTEVRSQRMRAIELLQYVRSVLLAEGERNWLANAPFEAAINELWETLERPPSQSLSGRL